MDCVKLSILRSLCREQLEELRTASESYREFTEDECQGHATVSNGRNADTDQHDFSESNSTTMDIDDDFILDMSDSDDIVLKVGG